MSIDASTAAVPSFPAAAATMKLGLLERLYILSPLRSHLQQPLVASWFLKQRRPPADAPVLEIGCATGRGLELLSSALPSSQRFVGEYPRSPIDRPMSGSAMAARITIPAAHSPYIGCFSSHSCHLQASSLTIASSPSLKQDCR